MPSPAAPRAAARARGTGPRLFAPDGPRPEELAQHGLGVLVGPRPAAPFELRERLLQELLSHRPRRAARFEAHLDVRRLRTAVRAESLLVLRFAFRTSRRARNAGPAPGATCPIRSAPRSRFRSGARFRRARRGRAPSTTVRRETRISIVGRRRGGDEATGERPRLPSSHAREDAWRPVRRSRRPASARRSSSLGRLWSPPSSTRKCISVSRAAERTSSSFVRAPRDTLPRELDAHERHRRQRDAAEEARDLVDRASSSREIEAALDPERPGDGNLLDPRHGAPGASISDDQRRCPVSFP